MKLLIIRPLPGADVTAVKAVELGFTPIVLSLFAVTQAAWMAPDPQAHDALLITSANAIRQGGSGLSKLRSLPVYAVGAASAAAAKAEGFTVVKSGESAGAQILQQAEADNHRRILWLSGEHTGRLNPPQGMQIDRRIVYKSAALLAPKEFVQTLQQPDIIAALHSPRAARHFASQCDLGAVDRRNVMIAALSSSVAEAAGDGWRMTTIAAKPNDAALLSAAKSCFTSLHRDPYC